MNSVTLYSNGTAVISRDYPLQDQQPLRIAIPVRKTDLDDVVSSLSVFGNVRITAPPTYTPTNAHETSLTLNPADVLKDLATKLAGAAVEIDAGTLYKGKLVGLHAQRREVERTVLQESRILVFTEKGIQQVPESAITAIRFTDPLVQSEIDKALQASLTQIKPDSRLVELAIEPLPGATSAVVVYATPVAAWKIRYQLRMSSDRIELEGQAVVDNDTDDDWIDTLITAITGAPITFSTDLAEIRRPRRSRVNIVADQATGVVMAGPVMDVSPSVESAKRREEPRSGKFKRQFAAPMERAVYGSIVERAEQEQAEVRESGDFSIFESPDPVTIRAQRSAVIPLFRTALGEAQAVLFYKEQDDAERPFRAVRLKHTAEHSLARGVCEVLIDGDFQGKCVLEPTKPGEEVLLIHAKDTGVRVFKKSARPEVRRMAVKISAGAVYSESRRRQKTEYSIRNSHPTEFTLEVEHLRNWTSSQLTISAETGATTMVEIPHGQRIRASLAAHGTQIIRVVEELLEGQSFQLEASWLQSNVVSLKTPAANHKGIQACLQLQADIDALLADVQEQEQAAKNLEEEQERLLKLIPKGHTEQANEWRTDLAVAEKELREIKKTTLPALQRKLQAVRKKLHTALENLQFTWGGDLEDEADE